MPSSSVISSLPWDSGRVISWFSCGAASAVATKLALEKYGAVEIFYTDTGSEHPDNHRFLADCEAWFGSKITTLKSTEYADAMEVCERQRYLSSPEGAPCTAAMKKVPANEQPTGVCALPLYHIFALNLCLLSMRLGSFMTLVPNPRDFAKFIKELKKRPFHMLPGVNTLFNAFLHNPDFVKLDFSAVKLCVGGGMGAAGLFEVL